MKCWVWMAATSAAASMLSAAPPAQSADTMLALAPSRITNDLSRVPTDAELEQRGAHIGRIDIQVDDVFEETVSLSAPYRVANGLHIDTHAETVRQQLLFRSGEPFHRRVLDETERLLRGQRYLNGASVTTVRYNEDNSVDVLGKQISLARSNDVDRTAWRLAYVDPNLLGSWWKLSSAYSSMSDGTERALALSHPFYALDSHWSANVGASDMDSAVSRYSLGKRVDRFNMLERQFDIGGGISEGLDRTDDIDSLQLLVETRKSF